MLIKNGRLISADLDMAGALEIHNGIINRTIAKNETLPDDNEVIDARGMFIMPGFVDIHMHAALGCDWTDGKVESVKKLAEYKLTEGVTTVLPTTLTLSHESLKAALAAIADYVKNDNNGARLPGVHLEGPYINPQALGAQNPAYARNLAISEVMELDSIFPVRKISLAPELPGALTGTEELIKYGIKIGAGHSKATFEEMQAAVAAGIDQLCHFGNQMTPLHHRDIGMVGAGLLLDELYVEIIADKIHLSPPMVQLVSKVKPHDKVILITDSTVGRGLPDGQYDSGGLLIEVKSGVARLVSNGALAGSTLKMNDALKNYMEISDLPLPEAIKAATTNPAKAAGLGNIGKLEPGFPADIAILDENFDVFKTLRQ